MSEPNPDPHLEIAHVLFIDIVGSSKLLTNEQSEVLRELNQAVRSTEQFRAAEASGKLIRLPTGITHLVLGKVYIQQRKYPEAIAEFGKARQLSHGNSEAIGSIGYVDALMGDKAKARAVLEELKTLSNQHYIPPYNIALVYHGLGQQSEALALLEKACEERDVRVTLLRVDPRWDSLRSNPRFVAILKRIGLQ